MNALKSILSANGLSESALREKLLETYQMAEPHKVLPIMQGLQVAPLSIRTQSGIRIHNIQTGYVAVKRAHRSYSGLDGLGILAIVADLRWTEWMPIYTWLIEHPEGLILVDTGETARALLPDYHNCDPGTAFFYHSFLRFAVTPEDEIAAQLEMLGIKPHDIRWLVQTHLHGDHVGGLNSFPKSEVLLSSLDYPDARGTLPCHYPSDFQPHFVSYQPNDLTAFGRGYALTAAKDVWIVPTAGHSAGHQSLILQDGDYHYFFAGDTSFSEEQMLKMGMAGIASDPKMARATLQNIQAYCQSHKTIYLPSHDPNSRQRLLNGGYVGR